MATDHIQAAVKNASRPPADIARDAARRPAEVLAFAGLKPGMKVAEWIPSGGYYTRLISGVVGPAGKVYAIDIADWDGGEDAAMAAEPGRENVALHLGPFGEFQPGEAVDLVWTAQNYHDLHVAEYGGDPARFNAQVHAALKPGGLYIVSDHEAVAGADDPLVARVHRIEKARVLREVSAAGFELMEESDLLRRGSDDHTVNSSDPAIRGQTDQFLLKFRKT